MADQDRSQRATPKRRQDARKRGQVVRSRELTGALGLLSVVLLLGWQARLGIESWRSLLTHMAGQNDMDLHAMSSVIALMSSTLVRCVAAPFALVWSISLASSVVQGGFVLSVDPLLPKLSRLSPANNLSNLFSVAGLGRMLKSLVPVVVMLLVAVSVARRDWMDIVASSRADLHPLLAWISGRLFELAWKCCLVLLAWSVADYFLQRRQLENSLKMTRQEATQESKDSETSPLIKGQIRKRRREMRKRWSMKDVERATAVVTNPDHFAVALEYRPPLTPAPIVLAKGIDEVALEIKRTARWNGVPIVENPPLAQALYRATEVGEAIPAKLYAAVAEILAFLYRTQANLRNSIEATKAASRPAAAPTPGPRPGGAR